VEEIERDAEAGSVAETSANEDRASGLIAGAATLALSACGAGDDGSPSGGGYSPPPPIPPTPIPPAPAPGPAPPPPRDAISSTEAEAVRFALQAQFSVSDADITALTSTGWLAWLQARYDEPVGETGVAWLNSQGHNAITTEKRYRARKFGDYMIWNQLLAGPDQMRKRMALALSETFVVSLNSLEAIYPSYLIAAYWDVLTAHAFGNFRQLLEALTLNAGMGSFLNTRGNLGENSRGRQP
jgi:hypothetical protein